MPLSVAAVSESKTCGPDNPKVLGLFLLEENGTFNVKEDQGSVLISLFLSLSVFDI